MAGHLIRKARRERGWSQGKLADRMNVRQATVSKLETGKSVQLDIFFKALTALNLDLEASLRETGSSVADLF